ncbi:MAG: efflux RND transporter permease subunit [Bacteroidota bacterium]
MKLVEVATRRRVTIAMFTVAILLFGSVSLSRLKVNLLPDLAYPTLTIRTEYAGAAPQEVENLIAKPIEEALGVVKNVQKLRSVSRTGQADVVLEFAWGTNMDYASLDVREKLDAIQLPLEADRPVLLRFDPSLDPIQRYGLFITNDPPDANGTIRTASLTSTDSDAYDDLKSLRRFADEELKKALESTEGVAAVKISGGLEDEVQVYIDQQRLAQLKLPIESITSVLRSENVNLSGGRLEQGAQQFLVRTVNQFRTVEEMEGVVVASRSGAPVYLRDVATVEMGFKERESITRIDGVEAVEVAIYKEGDANTVAVARALEGRMDYVNRLLPEGMVLRKVYDQSTFIDQAISDVVNAGLIGGLLAILILYFFLRDFATTFIISLSIPVSVVAAFNLMYGADLSLNLMSLGGLALGIGLLVDNAIVVLENVARHREAGLSRLESARRGTSEVGTAIIASTLTTVAVFFPLVFVTGIGGQLFRDQALTVTFSLLASLVVALTLIPMLASLGDKRKAADLVAPELTPPRTAFGRGLRKIRLGLTVEIPAFVGFVLVNAVRGLGWLVAKVFSPFVWAFNKGYDGVLAVYTPSLRWALRHRAVVVLSAFGMLAASLTLVPSLGIELIPQMAQDEFTVQFKLPPGTPIEQTDALLADMQTTAQSVEQIRMTFAASGSGNRMDANPDEGGENWGELQVALQPGSGDAGEAAASAQLRTALASVPGVQYKFERPTLFSFSTPIEVEVGGFDLGDLRRTSLALAQRMEETGRFDDVRSTMEGGAPEVQILFDRERAAALGVPVHTIADRVVSKVRGDVATRYSWRDRKIDVLVRAREEDRLSVEGIRRLIVNPESDRPVPLEAVADVRINVGPGEIRRAGQQRVAVVTANLAYGDLGSATEEIDRLIAGIALPSGVVVRQAGQSEEMNASFRSLLFALALAVFLVYLVMASQFESFLHPFVIFFSIPLALIGAIWALWLTGATVSVVVFIGLILLAGIVVNNAIVLIDLVNQLVADGKDTVTALMEAGRLRLRPILMTTLTTTLGLLPLALGGGEGAEIRAPMAITVIGGLVVSTVLTLVVIPVMYSLVARKQRVASA